MPNSENGPWQSPLDRYWSPLSVLHSEMLYLTRGSIPLQAPQTSPFSSGSHLILSLTVNLYSGMKLANSELRHKVTLIPPGPREHCVSSSLAQKLHLTGPGPLSPWILLNLALVLKLSLSHSFSCFLPVSLSSWLKKKKNQLSLPSSCLFFLHMKEVSMWNGQSIIRKIWCKIQKGLYQWNHKPWFFFVLAQLEPEQLRPHCGTGLLSDHRLFYCKPQSYP